MLIHFRLVRVNNNLRITDNYLCYATVEIENFYNKCK